MSAVMLRLCTRLRTRPTILASTNTNQGYRILSAFAFNYMNYSTEPLEKPTPDSVPKIYSSKIQSIVGEISNLTLQEVADLNDLLKETLKIKDVPVMGYSATPAAVPAAADEEEAAQEKIVKTSFTVKLTKFDDSKKVQLIKEIKSLVTGLNLVQAKKFVESVPQVVKADIGKTEADELVEKIKLAGGVCEVE